MSIRSSYKFVGRKGEGGRDGGSGRREGSDKVREEIRGEEQR